MQFNVLCYGDSNTWGYMPLNGARYPSDLRWPGVLSLGLGDRFFVVEEGLNGRTTALDDPNRKGVDGLAQLRPCLFAHKPLDLVIVLLGTNDLKDGYGQTMADIGKHWGLLVDAIQKSGCGKDAQAPEVLLVAPPPLASLPTGSAFSDGMLRSKEFGAACAEVAATKGCHCFDAGQVVESSPLDGVHWSAEGHENLGNSLAEMVLKVLA